MSEQRPPGFEPEDPDAGEPTGYVPELRQDPPADFLDRIRKKIHRRMLAGDVIDLSWRTPGLVLMQWLLMVVEFLRSNLGKQRGGSDG